ncbi:TetR/AcrR family transcriptional regulator [Frankia sp. AgPm24]|uniref:TetR/AcrR family transcriptional regulator n=1 Tax=Frankia sp. AgPm24 TaxID=631128 RepID=UPI00200CC300|nr:TetR/AcrR family transcriptional regulator [Frankia sp. AgPm24]MCK9925241.1 TetR/AcrR family transcriptional regulator [Frankia sp. AgPm24]
MTTSDARPPQPRRPADRAPSGVRIPRAPGRPRDPRTDEAIIAAALHELATVGFAGLSMEAVAASAGVGKATVYRRWPTKDALISDALDTLADEVDTVETGSLRDDLVAWLNALRRRNMHSLAGRIMPKLAAERTTHPDLFATYSHRVLEPSRRWAADLLRRGIDSGELAADVDVDLIVDMLIGPVSYRQYLSGDREVSGGRIARIVDVILVGIRTPAPDTDPITTATTATTVAAAAGGTVQLPATPAVAAAPNGTPASGTVPPSGGVATFSGAVVAGPQPAGGQLATPRLVAYPVGAPFALGQTYPVLGLGARHGYARLRDTRRQLVHRGPVPRGPVPRQPVRGRDAAGWCVRQRGGPGGPRPWRRGWRPVGRAAGGGRARARVVTVSVCVRGVRPGRG